MALNLKVTEHVEIFVLLKGIIDRRLSLEHYIFRESDWSIAMILSFFNGFFSWLSPALETQRRGLIISCKVLFQELATFKTASFHHRRMS